MPKHCAFIRKLRIALLCGMAILLVQAGMARADEEPQEGLISVENYWELFPHTVRHGNCLLTRVDNCNLIAVMNPHRSKADIAIIFVQGKSWDEIQKMAQNLRSDYFSKCRAKPFLKRNGFALLAGNNYLETGKLPTGNPLPVLLDDCSFTTWDDRRVLLDFRSGAIGAIRVAVYPEEFHAASLKLTISKPGNPSDFIKRWFCDHLYNHHIITDSSAQRNMVRSKYNLVPILIYTAGNIGIGKSDRDYYIGALDKLDHAIGKKKSDTAPFEFPAKSHDYQDLAKRPMPPAPNAKNALMSLLAFPHKEYSHFRVGECYIDCIFDPKQSDYLQMAFVTSYGDKKEALAVAQRIAQALGDDYTAKPFAMNESCAAIYTPRISMRRRADSALQLLFTPGLGMQQSIEFIGWKNIPANNAEATKASVFKQYLVVEIPVETPSSKGRVQITLDPYMPLTAAITEMRTVEGKVNFSEMLMDGRLCETTAAANCYKEKLSILHMQGKVMRLLENKRGDTCFFYRNGIHERPELFDDKLVAKKKMPNNPPVANWLNEPSDTPDAADMKEQHIDMATAQESDDLSFPAWSDTTEPQLTPAEALKAYLESLNKL